MNLDIQARSFNLTLSLNNYIQRKISASIFSRAEHIRRINVRLSDINGPHGGIDKRCHLHVIVPHLPDVIIEETQDNLYSAIDAAIARTREVLDRKLTRQRDRKRSSFSSLQQMSAFS